MQMIFSLAGRSSIFADVINFMDNGCVRVCPAGLCGTVVV
jgi:hypothetical protein